MRDVVRAVPSCGPPWHQILLATHVQSHAEGGEVEGGRVDRSLDDLLLRAVNGIYLFKNHF